jgi:hypothetical protein
MISLSISGYAAAAVSKLSPYLQYLFRIPVDYRPACYLHYLGYLLAIFIGLCITTDITT